MASPATAVLDSIEQAEHGAPLSQEATARQADTQKFLEREDRRKQKLTKQVSALEAKLERARHELQTVVPEPCCPSAHPRVLHRYVSIQLSHVHLFVNRPSVYCMGTTTKPGNLNLLWCY